MVMTLGKRQIGRRVAGRDAAGRAEADLRQRARPGRRDRTRRPPVRRERISGSDSLVRAAASPRLRSRHPARSGTALAAAASRRPALNPAKPQRRSRAFRPCRAGSAVSTVPAPTTAPSTSPMMARMQSSALSVRRVISRTGKPPLHQCAGERQCVGDVFDDEDRHDRRKFQNRFERFCHSDNSRKCWRHDRRGRQCGGRVRRVHDRRPSHCRQDRC